LAELVFVVVIVGIIAVVAAPRLANQQAYKERGFYDEALSVARYAQKFAVASGCEVQLSISGSTYTLNQRATDCTTGTFTRAVVNPGNRDASGFAGTAPSGITFTISSNPVVFNALGATADGTTRTVTVGTKSFQIIGASGFVLEAP